MERLPDHLNLKLGQLGDSTTLRHVYKRGDYSGNTVTATIKGERIDVSGDPESDNSDS